MVLIEDLESGMELAQDVFLTSDSIAPISRQGIVLTDYVIKYMRKKGIRSVHVKTPADLSEHTNAPVGKHSVVLTKQLRNDALDSLEDIFTAASITDMGVHESSVQLVTRIDNVVEQLVGSLLKEKDALVNINDLKSYDDYTFHHSLSVAVLSLAIGQYMGYSDKQLSRLGMCAMMHDIGKTAIPLDIIQKPSRLNDNEFNLIKTHSTAGYNYLTHAAIGDEDMWRGVLHHHEKFDGTGYPLGLKGIQIPEWSRIISVADVYDALTSNRPYRKPMEPSDALEYIMGGSGTAFDFDIISAMMKKVDLYPIGCEIELSDGRIADVLDNENQTRPIVRLQSTGETMDLYRDRQCLSIVIKQVVSMPANF